MPAQQLILPAQQVIVHGEYTRVEMQVGANATVAKMIPGAIVIYDAVENSVKEAAAKARGVLGIIDVDATHDIDDTYAVGENIPILIPNSGTFVALIFLANEDFTPGDALVTGASGTVAENAVAALGSQGDIVATAWHAEAGAANVRVVCRWNLCPEGAAII